MEHKEHIEIFIFLLYQGLQIVQTPLTPGRPEKQPEHSILLGMWLDEQ